MSPRSGVDDGQRFEHLPLMLLLGVKRVAEVIRAATERSGEALAELTASSLDDVLLGVLSIDEQLTDLVGTGESEVRRPQSENPNEDLLR